MGSSRAWVPPYRIEVERVERPDLGAAVALCERAERLMSDVEWQMSDIEWQMSGR